MPVDDGLSTTPFPKIGGYGFLSDCRNNALIAPSGNVEWMCLPRPDSPSIFGAILDRSAGGFEISPDTVQEPAARRYVPGTMVLETSWETPSGWLLVHDALLVGPWYHDHERSSAHQRIPGDYEAECVLLRVATCINGSVDLTLNCEPVLGYGKYVPEWSHVGDGYGEAVGGCDEIDLELTLRTDMRLGFYGGIARAQTRLKKGETEFVALSWTDHQGPRDSTDAFARLQSTQDYWREWLSQGTFPDHPWRSFIQRSALTLKGLTYTPTGAMLAAPTTSLPEAPHGERNWDYRYTWIRDSSFMLWSLYTLGFNREADDFFAFITEASSGGELQVMYGIEGERKLTESTLDWLTGYEGARPVRIGNGAYDQRQLDVYGTAIDSIYLHFRSRDHLPREVWPFLESQVEAAITRWQEPDRGIWEIRGDPKHFTFSKIMCWVAADRGAQLARLMNHGDHGKRWEAAAKQIHADVLEKGVDKRGVLTMYYGGTALDASLLWAPLVKFLPGDDEVMRKTVLTIADELTVDGLVLRYKPEETDDGLDGSREGAFSICSFMLVSALTEIGEHERAHKLLEKLLGYASTLGLYAEEIDPESGRHLGNFPQAFTHLSLINAVLHVIRAEERTRVGAFNPRRTVETS